MRMRRIYVVVSERTLDQLAEVAERERRAPRQQAAYMLERAVVSATETATLQSTSTNTELVLA